MSARVRIKVTGMVQGVGFRYYAYRIAKALSVKGYVKNQRDGSVEVLAEGEKSRLIDLISELRIGPPESKVENLLVEWQQNRNEFDDFKILK